MRKVYLKSRELYEANRQNQVWMRCKTKIDAEIKRVLAERSLNKLLCEETVLSPKLHLFPPHRLSPPSQQTCERCFTMFRMQGTIPIPLKLECLYTKPYSDYKLLALCIEEICRQASQLSLMDTLQMIQNLNVRVLSLFQTSPNIANMSAPSRILKPQTRNISTALPPD